MNLYHKILTSISIYQKVSNLYILEEKFSKNFKLNIHM